MNSRASYLFSIYIFYIISFCDFYKTRNNTKQSKRKHKIKNKVDRENKIIIIFLCTQRMKLLLKFRCQQQFGNEELLYVYK